MICVGCNAPVLHVEAEYPDWCGNCDFDSYYDIREEPHLRDWNRVRDEPWPYPWPEPGHQGSHWRGDNYF